MKYAIIRDGYVGDLDGTLIEVPNDFTDYGYPSQFYNEDWSVKSEAEIIKQGLAPMPKGWKFNDDKSKLIKENL